MRIRYIGLAVAGSVLLGAWLVMNQAIAAPKTATAGAGRVTISVEQQDLASAWYRELGKIKHRGLAAAQHGNCREVKSSILKAGIVITDAKKGEGTLGKLPNYVRGQIAEEGRKVVKALSGRCGNRAAKEKDRNSLYAPSPFDNLIVRWFPERTPSSKSSGGSARRSAIGKVDGIVVNDRDTDFGPLQIDKPGSVSGSIIGLHAPERTSSSTLHSGSSRGAALNDDMTTFFGGLPLFSALFSEPPAETEERQLREAASHFSRAQAAYSQGPSASGDAQISFETHRESLEFLEKNARSPRVRRVARRYLSRLPKHFVSGHNKNKKVSDKTWARRRHAGPKIQQSSQPRVGIDPAIGSD